jgi:hypothetical protein
MGHHYDVTMNRSDATTTSKRKNGHARVAVTIRVPEIVLRGIDDEVAQSLVPTSRNNWLIDAAVRKLGKKITGGKNGS